MQWISALALEKGVNPNDFGNFVEKRRRGVRQRRCYRDRRDGGWSDGIASRSRR